MEDDRSIYGEFTNSIEIDGKAPKIIDVSLEEVLESMADDPKRVHAIMEDTDGGDGMIENIDELICKLSNTVINIKFDLDEIPDPNKEDKLER